MKNSAKPNLSRSLGLLTILIIITIIYLIKLDFFPVFADEAIYINWADRIFNRFEGPFISLNDGKPPLFIWIIGFFTRIFTKDLLFASRLASVTLFLFFLVIVYLVLKKHHNNRQAIYTLILLAFSPYIYFHTRLSLLDSALSVFLILGLLFCLTPKIKYHHLLSGVFFGLAYWTKTPAMFLIPFPLISALINKPQPKSIAKACISIFISLSMIYLLKVSVFYHKLFQRSQDFTFTPSQLLQGETNHILNNIKDFISWFNAYNYYPYLILVIIGIIIGLRNKNQLITHLTLASLIFSSPFIFLGKVVSSRYYLPSIFIFSMLAAYAVSRLRPKILSLVVLFISLIYPFYQINHLLTDYYRFKLPDKDEYQYLKEWSSGIGIKDSFEFLTAQAQNKKIKILTEGYFGTTPDGLFIYYASLPYDISKNIEIIAVGNLATNDMGSQIDQSNQTPTYYLGNSNRIDKQYLDKYNLKLIKDYPKKDNFDSFQIYLVNSHED